MRNQLWKMWMIALLCLVSVVMVDDTEASAKSKVTFQVKGTTLTVSGKGKMPSTGKVKNPKKIKKVIIKKGVTEISDNAFDDWKKVEEIQIANSVKKIGYYAFSDTAIKSITIPKSVKEMGEGVFSGCGKLKKVTMPGKIKMKQWPTDDALITFGGSVETISFNTDLDLKTIVYLDAQNLIVRKEDKKFCSIEGMIYSKDGKSIVRVPSLRKKAVIMDGCEEFCLQSVLWCGMDWESDPAGGCEKLKYIELPDSIKKVEAKKYYKYCADDDGMIWEDQKVEIKICNKSLGIEALQLLNEKLKISWPNLYSEVSGAFREVGVQGMYVGTDSQLKAYDGKEKQIIIPDGVTHICEDTFAGNKYIEEIYVPATVTEIEGGAFSECKQLEKLQLSEGVVTIGGWLVEGCNNLKELTIPGTVQKMKDYAFADCGIEVLTLQEGLKKIGDCMVANCANLKVVKIPDSVEVIGAGAFATGTSGKKSSLQKIDLGKGVKRIEYNAFGKTSWTELVIPAQVEEIDSNAFQKCTKAKRVVIESANTQIHSDAFYNTEVKLVYPCPIERQKTYIMPHKDKIVQNTAKKKTKTCKLWLQWWNVEGMNGVQIKLSSNKTFSQKTKTYHVNKKTKLNCVRPVLGKYEYIKIRPYKIENGTKVYGAWTTTKYKWFSWDE